MRTPNIRAEAAHSARAIPLCFQRPGSRKDPGLFIFSSAGGDRAARRCSFTICRGDAAPALAGARPANNRSGGPQWAQPCPRSAPLRVCPSRHHRRAAFATGPVGCAGSRAPTCSESARRSVWPVLAWGHSRSGGSREACLFHPASSAESEHRLAKPGAARSNRARDTKPSGCEQSWLLHRSVKPEPPGAAGFESLATHQSCAPCMARSASTRGSALPRMRSKEAGRAALQSSPIDGVGCEHAVRHAVPRTR